jgi:hypothetical protein
MPTTPQDQATKPYSRTRLETAATGLPSSIPALSTPSPRRRC